MDTTIMHRQRTTPISQLPFKHTSLTDQTIFKAPGSLRHTSIWRKSRSPKVSSHKSRVARTNADCSLLCFTVSECKQQASLKCVARRCGFAHTCGQTKYRTLRPDSVRHQVPLKHGGHVPVESDGAFSLTSAVFLHTFRMCGQGRTVTLTHILMAGC